MFEKISRFIEIYSDQTIHFYKFIEGHTQLGEVDQKALLDNYLEMETMRLEDKVRLVIALVTVCRNLVPFGEEYSSTGPRSFP